MRRLTEVLLGTIFLFSFLLHPGHSHAQTQSQEGPIEAQVIRVISERTITVNESEHKVQTLELRFTKGQNKGKTITIDTARIPTSTYITYQPSDRVLITPVEGEGDANFYYITDTVRRPVLYWLFGLFVALTLIIGRLRGAASLIGMVFSFIIIIGFILPQILGGQDPVIMAILGSFFIIPVTFYLSHGLNRKTTAAVLGTVLSLIATGILSVIFVNASRLSGFASEEAVFLQAQGQTDINARGLLLAGIIIGLLGILDDITISQAAIVAKLRETARSISSKELYKKAMDIGRDHIASTVNTLVLVYTGAALPLLLLFMNNSQPFDTVINYEVVAEEIIRTLVASCGLIIAVPITTIIATAFERNSHA